MIAIILRHAHTCVGVADYTEHRGATSLWIFAILIVGEFRIEFFRFRNVIANVKGLAHFVSSTSISSIRVHQM